MQGFKRVLSFILVLSLMVSMLPAAALKAEAADTQEKASEETSTALFVEPEEPTAPPEPPKPTAPPEPMAPEAPSVSVIPATPGEPAVLEPSSLPAPPEPTELPAPSVPVEPTEAPVEADPSAPSEPSEEKPMIWDEQVAPVYGSAKTEEGLYYEIDEEAGTVTITDYSGSAAELAIPSELEGYPVTAIGDSAFSYANFTSVTIPDSITTIGYQAFYYCDDLTELIMPDSVITIGSNAFGYCHALTTVTLSESLTSMGDYAFYDCSALTEITISGDAVTIGNYAFCSCDVLNSVTLAAGVETIGQNAFQYCNALTTVIFSETLTSIGDNAFYDCNALEEITVCGNSATIGERAFYNCDKLTSVTIADGVAEIGEEAFSYCNTLTTVTMADSVTTIGANAFVNIDTLTSVSFSAGLVSIGDMAFYDCDSLKEISLSGNEAVIGSYAFYSCNALEVAVLAEGVTGIGQYAFGFCDALTSLTLSESLTSIGSHAFYDCDGLTEITIPGNSATIGEQAFYACGGLTTVTMTDGVEEIGRYAFGGCDALAVVSISDSVTVIGEHAFSSCYKLVDLTLPAGLTSLGDHAFYDCDGLTEITIPGSAASIGESAFYHCGNLKKIAILDGVIEIGTTAFSSCNLLEDLTIADTVTTIGNYAFAYCDKLTEVTLPANLMTLGNYAFYDCDGFTEIKIPNAVTSIGEDAFRDCGKLASVTVSDSVTSIGRYAFADCGALNDIILPSGLANIEEGLFSNCDGLSEIAIPGSAASIGSYAFYSCGALTSVEISTGTTAIGDNAFYGCGKLESAALPEGLVSIGEQAFLGCYALANVSLPDSITAIGEFAFAYCDSLTDVPLPSSLTNISVGLFYDCDGLTAITIPVAITEIGERAFTYCDALKEITLPDGVAAIGRYTFAYCDALTKLTLPGSLNTISEGLFYDSDALTEIVIPESITSIGNSAFSECGALASLTVPDSVTEIGTHAFAYCDALKVLELSGSLTSISEALCCDSDGLTEIVIPESVTSIGKNAFQDCDALASITIPDSVSEIGTYAFAYCDSLNSVYLSAGLTAISNGLFSECRALTEIVIPEGITSIGNYVFNNCDALANVKIPDSVTTIGAYTFEYCDVLTSVSLPANLASIGDCLFYDCNALAEIVIPENVTSIGHSAFSHCDSLSSVMIPDSVTTINNHAFAYSDSLADITLPAGLTTITYDLFYDCDALAEIVIPESVTTIEYSAFSHCDSLVSITIPDAVTTIGNHAFAYCDSLTDINLPAGITTIPYGLFNDSDAITEIVIPENITSIADFAFYSCDKLSGITIPDTVSSIGYSAFAYCDALKNVTLPAGLTHIEDNLFYECNSLTEIVIPESVTSIDSSAFGNCDALASVTIPDSVKTIADYAFSNCDMLTSVTLPMGMTVLEYELFYDCDALEEIVIPETVTTIEGYVFYDCDALDNVVIPGSVTNIGTNVFRNCDALTAFTLPAGITSIPQEMFYDCDALTEVSLPETVTEIGSYAFAHCDALADVQIPDGVATIGSYAFGDCADLANIILPTSLTTIADYLFYNCDSLTSIDIPDSITSIGYGAFAYCDVLTTVVIPLTCDSISNAFYGSNNVTIYGLAGSRAESFASEQGIPFESITESDVRISVTVQDENGSPITSGYSIEWYCEDELVGGGNTMWVQDNTKTYAYQVVLDEKMIESYYPPEKTSFTVGDEDVLLTCTLKAVPMVTITGKLLDEEGNTLSGTVEVEQDLGGEEPREVFVNTQSDGGFSLDVLTVPVTITIQVAGYRNRILSLDLKDRTEPYNLGDLAMAKLPSNKITLDVVQTNAARENETATTTAIPSFDELVFTVRNVSKGTDITAFTAQYPYLLLDGGQAEGGDLLQVKATNTKDGTVSAIGSITLDEQTNGNGTVTFLQRGRFEIDQISGNSQNRIMIFDSFGNLVDSVVTGGSYQSSDLNAGSYQVVLLTKTDLLRSVSAISVLNEYGLIAGTDYVKKDISVANGVISVLESVQVPVLDESKLYYTEKDSTSFTASAYSTFAGKYVMLRAQYQIKEEFTTSSQKVIIEIPEGLSVASGSLTINNKVVPFTMEGNKITANVNQPSGTVRFYLFGSNTGKFRINSSLQFALNGSTVTQPLGTVDLELFAAQMNLPEKTCGGRVTVTGKAVPNSTITFYDTGEEIGTATSNTAGNFKTELSLEFAGKYTYHEISATVANEKFSEPLAVEGQILINDEEYAQVSKITMINIAHDNSSLEQVEYVSEFDFINPGPAPNYWFWPGCYPEFTFIVEFVGDGASRVENVNIVTMSNGGDETIVECYYDKANDRWLGTHLYNNANDAPLGVRAIYDIIGEDSENTVPELDTDLIDDYIAVFEEITGSDRVTLEDWNSAMEDVEVDTETEFSPEDADNLDELAQTLDELMEELNKTLQDIYYNEQNQWADQNVSYTESGNTQTYETNGQKLEISTETLTDVTAQQLLDEGYQIQAGSDKVDVYERYQDDGTLDRVVLNNPGNGTAAEATKVSTKSTNLSGDDGTTVKPGEVIGDIATNIPMWASIGGDYLDNFSIPKVDKQIDTLKTVADQLRDNGKEYYKLYQKLDVQDEVFDPLYKQYYWNKYTDCIDAYGDTARAIDKLENVKGWAKVGKKAGKVLGYLGTAATVAEFAGYHFKLGNIEKHVPESCPKDTDDWKQVEKDISSMGKELIAADVVVGGGEIAGYVCAASGVGFGVSVALSVGNTAVQAVWGARIRASMNKIRNALNALDCNGDGKPDMYMPDEAGDNGTGFMPATTVIDPSGYVYEAVPSNRIAGVKAEAYYLGYALDEYGVPKEEPEDILWDAENYDQVNPVYTDELGMFHWDVPMGQWLVKYSKEGYYDTDSRNDPAADADGYLPVPPPQVDVNIGIVSKAAPTVESVNIYDKEIQIIFSQYMDLDTVNSDNVIVECEDQQVSGKLEAVNAEYNYEETEQFATVFRFVPDSELTGEINVAISDVRNYAGTQMENDYGKAESVAAKPEQISINSRLALEYNAQGTFNVQILPAEAGANKKLNIKVAAPGIVSAVSESVTTNSEGKASFSLNGQLPGSSDIVISLDGTDLQTTVVAEVSMDSIRKDVCAKVQASIPSGSKVAPGTQLTLSTTTQGASIYYTLDGTCPCIVDSASRILYTGPITIQEDMFLIAYAVKDGLEDSKTSGFTYTACAHSFGDWETVKEASCLEEGSRKHTCAGCGEVETEKVNALDHDKVNHEAQAPTCTEIGWDAYVTCSRCDYTTYVEKAVLGHDEITHEAQAPTCTEIGWDAYVTCSRCDYTTYAEIPYTGHTEVTDKAVAATCTETGKTEGKHCSVCNTVIVKQETVPMKPHTEVVDKAVAATCAATGKTEGKHCSVCNTVILKQNEVPALGHKEETVKGKAATCTENGLTDGKKCSVCNAELKKQENIPAKGHSFQNGKCTVCSADDPNYVKPTEPKPTEPAPTEPKPTEPKPTEPKPTEPEPTEPAAPEAPTVTGVTRVFGDNRYKTGFAVADQLKRYMGVEKFNTMVIACGTNFADALAGSYLANQKDAPILLVNKHTINDVKDYVTQNLASGGTVYLLGGEAAVPAEMQNALNGLNVKRLAGANRYATNLLILNEAGTSGQEILICTGKGFADSLSASAVNKPILLVNKKLDKDQKAFLEKSSGKFVIIGGESAVSAELEAELKTYGSVERIGGANRYETSVLVARRFFNKPSTAVLAYAKKFPDGLCGGPLAYSLKAPLILTATKVEAAATAYTKENGIQTGIVLGGEGLISNDAVGKIMG